MNNRLRRACLLVAALPALAAACSGGSGGPRGDAEGLEATISVQDHFGRGVAGALVAVHDSNGGFLAAGPTDDNGVAKLAIASSGGSVTLYRDAGDSLLVETVFRAGAGPIRFIVEPRFPYPEFPEPTIFQVTATVPTNAALVRGDSRCFSASSAESTNVVELTDDPCPGFESESIFLSARNATGGEISWGFEESVQKDPGGTVNVTAAALSTGYVDWTVAADLPPGAILGSENGGVVGCFTDDLAGQRDAIPVSHVSTNGSHTWISRLPDADFPAYGASVSAGYSSGQVIGFSLSSTGGNTVFSFAGLPFVAVSPLDSTDASRPLIRWTLPPSLDASVGVAGAVWSLESGAYVNFLSSFPLDESIAEVRVPELPPDLASWSGPAASVLVTYVEYRRSSLVHSPADIAADYYRGMGPMQTPLGTTFLSAQSTTPALTIH